MSKNKEVIFEEVYLRQLESLRKDGTKFAKSFPELAPMLDLTNRKSSDPETERLIESFAYLIAQLEVKINQSQGDFLKSFIECLFPEIINPIPPATILKLNIDPKKLSTHPDKKVKKKNIFQVHNNYNGKKCHFTNDEAADMLPVSVIECRHVNNLQAKKTKQNQDQGIEITLQFDESIYKDIYPNQITLRLFINADYENALRIYDSLFSYDGPIFFSSLDNSKIAPFDRKVLQPVFHFSHYLPFDSQEKNIVFPLFQVANFFQKFLFIDIKIKKEQIHSETMKLFISINPEKNHQFIINDESFLTNCVHVTNIYEKKLEPLLIDNEKDEHLVIADLNYDNDYEVFMVHEVETTDVKTNKILRIRPFHNTIPELESLRGEYVEEDLYWATRKHMAPLKNLYTHVYLTLIKPQDLEKNLDSELLDEEFETRYLFLKGMVSDVNNAESIPVETQFYSIQALPIENAYNVLKPSLRLVNKKIFAEPHFINLIFGFNEEMLSGQIVKFTNILKILKYTSFYDTELYRMVESIETQIVKVSLKQSNKQNVINGQSYQIPGYIYEVYFRKEASLPTGIWFFKTFLNAYFEEVKVFNYFLQMDIKLI